MGSKIKSEMSTAFSKEKFTLDLETFLIDAMTSELDI
jgi:hypothetical protein